MTTPVYHELNVTFSFSERPKHDTPEEYDDYLKALGRLVEYAMGVATNRAEEGAHRALTLANIGVRTTRGGKFEEAIAVYPDTLSEKEGRFWEGPTAQLDEVRDKLWAESVKGCRAFVMGAVRHSDGKIGFHS